MENTQQGNHMLQWHPAFYAGIQIELEDDKDNLIFENEHQLGTKPMEIDILIIKKEKELPVKKNIGRIFRKYNIIEYKSPTDYLSIDDFYKVYGYLCFYKSDSTKTNEIPFRELTMTLVCFRYPDKLMTHFQEELKYSIENPDKGIFYIIGNHIPIQVIVTSLLPKETNLWLRSLTDHLDSPESARELIQEYGKHKNNKLYESVMDIILHANISTFQEVKGMCKALEELMKDELEAARMTGLEQGIQTAEEKGIKTLIETCRELGLSRRKTTEKIMEKYTLSSEKAEEYMKIIWPNESAPLPQ